MASQIDGRFKTFKFASAVSAWVRVAVSNGTDYGQRSTTALNDETVGILQEDVAADGSGTVKLFNETFMGIITGVPVTRGDIVFSSSNGQYCSTVITGCVTAGILLETPVSNGSVVEIYPIQSKD